MPDPGDELKSKMLCKIVPDMTLPMPSVRVCASPEQHIIRVLAASPHLAAVQISARESDRTRVAKSDRNRMLDEGPLDHILLRSDCIMAEKVHPLSVHRVNTSVALLGERIYNNKGEIN